MEEAVFTFPSFTYANKARKLLLRAGINADSVKLGARPTNDGCAHGLSVSSADFYSAVKVFIENKIDYGVYKR